MSQNMLRRWHAAASGASPSAETECYFPKIATKALNAYRGLGYGIHFWRTKSKHEVDVVLYGEAGLVAIEVKASARVRASDLDGLKLFRLDYPMARARLVYAGTRRYHDSGIEIVPLEDFFGDAQGVISQ